MCYTIRTLTNGLAFPWTTSTRTRLHIPCATAPCQNTGFLVGISQMNCGWLLSVKQTQKKLHIIWPLNRHILRSVSHCVQGLSLALPWRVLMLLCSGRLSLETFITQLSPSSTSSSPLARPSGSDRTASCCCCLMAWRAWWGLFILTPPLSLHLLICSFLHNCLGDLFRDQSTPPPVQRDSCRCAMMTLTFSR